MESAAQTVLRMKGMDDSYNKKAIYMLKKELEKGINSMKNGKVYTINEAWKEIDKI